MTHEKSSNIRDTSLQVLSIMIDEDEVIDISAIVSYPQYFLHVHIELVHIDIREELTREIAYGESTSWSRIEEALRSRKSYPVYPTAMDDHISLRI